MVRGRCVAVSFAVLACFVVGMTGMTPASAQGRVPTPTDLIVGPRLALPSELYVANPVGSPALVTPSQARAIAAAMWLQWEGAQISRNTTALSQLSPPGTLLSGELYQCAWPTGGCVAETHPRPVNNVTAIVPVQRSYPIHFLAEVSTIQNIADGNALPQWVPWIELQVLTKASPSAPWQLSFDTGYNGTDNRQPPLLPFALAPTSAAGSSDTEDLYNPALSETPTPTPGSAFLPLLAQYYQSFKDTGRPPADDRFEVGGGASGYGAQLATSPQGNVAMGSRSHYDFTADPSAGEWAFAGPGGLPIECGTVLDTATNTPVGSPALLQNPDRTNFGMPLAPGVYSSITTTVTHPTCVEDVDGMLDAAGDSGYTTDVSGPHGISGVFVVGLSMGIGGVVIMLGAVVVVAVFVTRRRRVSAPAAAYPGPVQPWRYGPGAPMPGMPSPTPTWAPPPPPPPPGPGSTQAWPPPSPPSDSKDLP